MAATPGREPGREEDETIETGTAAAASKLGLECGLVLWEGRHNELTGNLLLDQLFGAVVERHPPEAVTRRDELMAALAKRWKRPYIVPYGGSSAVGAAAYVWAYQELLEQLGDRGGTLFCVTSSGATHAGLAIGEALLHGPAVVGVSIADPAAGREFFEHATSKDKQRKQYDGLLHEIFHEPERDLVFRDLIGWLDERARGAQGRAATGKGA